MDKFKKIFLFLLELEEQTHVHLKNQEISKMVNMKNFMVHTNLKYIPLGHDKIVYITDKQLNVSYALLSLEGTMYLPGFVLQAVQAVNI